MPIDIMSPIQALEGAAEKKIYNDQRVEQARYLADVRQQLHIMDNTSKETRAKIGLEREQEKQRGQKELAEIKANASNKSSEEKTKQEASKVEQQKEKTKQEASKVEQQKEVTKQEKQATKQEQEKTVQSNNQRLTANSNARAEKYKANSSVASQSAVNRLQEEQNAIKENTLKRYGGVE